jgi:four helix bundle protein
MDCLNSECPTSIRFDLEARMIKYSVRVHEVVELLPLDHKGASYLAGQLIRSGTAPALIYGEAIAAESRKDFIHKMKIALKELRESCICLKIIQLKVYIKDVSSVNELLTENNELISIFVKSIKTAKHNLEKKGN